MRNDAYTKTVLTVIAGCLLWLCARDLFGARIAQAAQAQPVTIVGVAIPDHIGERQRYLLVKTVK